MRRPVSSVSKPAVNRTVQQQNEVRQKRRHQFCLVLTALALLLAGGTWLLRQLPFSLWELGSMIKQAVVTKEAPAQPANLTVQPNLPPPALRGAIYDRNMEEMAVSYQLFSLLARPAEMMIRQQEAAERLAAATGTDAQEMLRRFQSGEQTVELAVGIAEEQAKAIDALKLPGVFCKPVEVRYYPGHAAAGHLLGFISDSVGLSGFEALYDGVLQPGEFRKAEAPDVNFAGQRNLGPQAADVVLAIDLKLQKQIEELLNDYRQQQGAAAGYAVAFEPDSGQMLAVVRQPSFDPNYFWQTDGPQDDSLLFPAEFTRELLQPLLVEAAAVWSAGIDTELLPTLLSPPDFSPSQEQIDRCWQEFGFSRPVQELVPFDLKQNRGDQAAAEENGQLNAAQAAVGIAALLNGGKRVSPWFLQAVYDPDQQRFFNRDPSASSSQRMISPAAGVHLRRHLLHNSSWGRTNGFLFFNSNATTVLKNNGLSEQHLQDILIAAVPQDNPRILLTLAVDYARLQPPPGLETGQLEALGQKMLALLTAHATEKKQLSPLKHPQDRNEANLRRFLLSRQLTLPAAKEKKSAPAEQVMPDLIGLSLRHGLQRLNSYKLKMRVIGSGRIVAQKPASGISLAKINNCELILEPFFKNEEPLRTAAKPAAKTERKSPARKSEQQNTPNHP